MTTKQIAESWCYTSERLPAAAWEIIRTLVFMRDNCTCRWCGYRGGDIHCDHIMPLARGGTNSPYNLQTLCATCNQCKRAARPPFVIKADGWKLWHALIRREPGLVDVFLKAIALKDDPRLPSFCANAHFYGHAGLKVQLSNLVGNSQRGDPYLGTSEAYDAAYEVIYNTLPNCRNCWCG